MLTPRTVFDIHKITDPESSRYALGGVRFERDDEGRPLAIATDGRRLMVLGWRETDADKYPLTAADSSARLPAGAALLIPGRDCREAAQFKVGAGVLKSKKYLGCSIIDESAADGQPVKIAASNLEKSVCDVVKQIEGRYPKWRDIITPAVGEAVHSIEVNAQYLVELVEVAAKHCRRSDGESRVVLSLDAADPSHCGLVITAANTEGAGAYGILMPACDDNKHNQQHAGAAWLPVELSKAKIKEAAEKARQAIAERLGADGKAADGEKSTAEAVAAAVAAAVAEAEARFAVEREAANRYADAAKAEAAKEKDELIARLRQVRSEFADLSKQCEGLKLKVAAAEQAARLASKAAAEKQAAPAAVAAPPAPIALAKPAALTITEEREPGRRFSHLSPPVSIPLAAASAIVATAGAGPQKIAETPRGIVSRAAGVTLRRPPCQIETDEDRRRIISAVHC